MQDSARQNEHSEQPVTRRVPGWLGYVVAFLAVLLLTLGLDALRVVFPGVLILIPYILLTMGIAYYFGLWPAVLSILLCAFSQSYVYVAPIHAVWPLAQTHGEWVRFWFLIGGLVAAAWAMLAVRKLTIALRAEVAEHVRAEQALKRSEEQYRRIVETANEGIWMVDREANTTYANHRMAEMLGYELEEVMARRLMDFMLPEDAATMWERFGRRMEGVAESYELRFVRKDGGILWTLANAVPVYDDAGERVVGAFAMLTDITKRKRTEEALRESQDDLNRAQEIAKLGSWRLDIRRNELVWSDEAYRIFGVEPGTPLTYEDFLSFVHPDDREYVDRKWQETLRGETYDIAHRIVLPDGSVKWVRETAELEFDEQGAVIGGFGTVQEITETVLLREELSRALEATQGERERVAAMEKISEVGISAQSLHDALGTITVRIREAMKSHSCTLFLYDEETDELEACAACNVPGIVGLRIPRCDCFVWSIFLGGGPSYVRDVKQTPLTRIPQIEEAGVKSVLGVPLVGRAGPVGVVYVDTLVEREYAPEEVRLLQEMASRTALIIENVRLGDALAENFGMLQRALLPPKPPDVVGYDIATTYLPGVQGAQIGGDFYDVFLTETGHLAVLIGDVTGKGIPSASLASATRSTLRAFVYDTSKPGESLSHTNAVVSGGVEDVSLFVTAFAAVIDHHTGRILYSGAGHPPPAIWHRETGEVELMGLGGPPVGVFPAYGYAEHEARLMEGDKIIFHTDGLDEARRHGEMLGLERVAGIIRENGAQSPGELVSVLVSAATRWADGHLQDDMAIVVIECERSE